MIKSRLCAQLKRATCRLGFLILAIGLTIVQSDVQAQDYLIENWVLSNGGGQIIGANYVVNGTVGQPCIGTVSNQSYQILSGIGHSIHGIVPNDVLDDFEQISTLPSFYMLEQNYPNPFNPITTIRFALPRRSQVTLQLYNVLGQIIATLVDDELSAGEYQVRLNGEGLSSGVYFYQITAGDFVQGRKLVLLK